MLGEGSESGTETEGVTHLRAPWQTFQSSPGPAMLARKVSNTGNVVRATEKVMNREPR